MMTGAASELLTRSTAWMLLAYSWPMRWNIRSAPERSSDQIRAAISAIDKAAKSGVIHRNAANRRKARLNKALVAK